jgi:RNA ligase (TIGR02306 family)
MSNIELNQNLAVVGKVISLSPIKDADFIESATVVCGKAGKWTGIVKKDQFQFGSMCLVYMPDAQIPPHDDMKFMEASNWRVKMRRFKGSPSEVVIMPLKTCVHEPGHDYTEYLGVTKYCKPIPPQLNGVALGDFPSFIPKTDEPNYQRSEDLIIELVGKPYYITEKADGSSTTAYKYLGHFGVCSRNLELVRNPDNGYWKVAEKYRVEELLPDGIAIQWETCGPGIQSNPMGLKEIDGYLFSAYNIYEHRYLEYEELINLCIMPLAKILAIGKEFSKEGLELLGEGQYSNGKQREGVVVRSTKNIGFKPISFKVINLRYEK